LKSKATPQKESFNCFNVLSDCLIKNRGKLQLFRLADKLKIIQENLKRTIAKPRFSFNQTNISKEHPLLQKSDSLKMKKQIKILKTSTGLSEISLKKQKVDDLRITRNVNNYMIDVLQKELGKLDNFKKVFPHKKDGEKGLIRGWSKNLAFSIIKK